MVDPKNWKIVEGKGGDLLDQGLQLIADFGQGESGNFWIISTDYNEETTVEEAAQFIGYLIARYQKHNDSRQYELFLSAGSV